MIKYTFLGFWFIWMLSVIVSLIIKKDYQKMLYSSAIFLTGMFIPFGLWCIYFIYNNALFDFIYAYFMVNIFAYTNEGTLLSRVVDSFDIFFKSSLSNNLIIFLLVIQIPSFIKNISLSKYGKFFLASSIIFAILGIYIGGVIQKYYILILLPFILLSLINICKYFNLHIDKVLNWRFGYILYIVFYCVTILLSFYLSSNIYLIGMSKNTMVQYNFAQIINKEKDPTILNYRELDWGFYTTTNTLPNVKYFHQQNLSYDKYPENADEQSRYIDEQKTMFIVYPSMFESEIIRLNMPFLFEKYDLIASDNQYFEGKVFNVYLFKRIDKI